MQSHKKNSGRLRLSLATGVVGGFAIAGVALASLPAIAPFAQQSNRKSTEAPIMSRGKLCNELFLAIDHRDTKEVEALLARGADPNSRNGLDFTPLYIAAASYQPEVVEALIKAGAKPDARSPYGAPITFASATANIQAVNRLLELGVEPDVIRVDGLTPLMFASYSGAVPVVQELLKRKVDVNNQNDGGATALTLAARQGHLEVAKALIAAKADVNVADEEGMTPLMGAAMNGHAEVAKLLIENGAKVDEKENRGRTALLLASSYGDYPEVVKVLVDAKANVNAKDDKGRTGVTLAATRGYTQTVSALGGMTSARVSSQTPRQAVDKSLKLIASSMVSFSEASTCVSCHQEGLGRMTTGDAAARGFKIDPKAEQIMKGRVNGMVGGMRPLLEGALQNHEVMMKIPLIEINEVSPIGGWVMNGMASQNSPANAGTAALAMVLARQQTKDGCWTFSLPRVPMQSSVFTMSALAVRAMNTYGPKAYASEIAKRRKDAKNWFVNAPAKTSEDRASRLLGLKWSGASADARRQATAEIVADQRADGGWSQMPNLASDAYATGQALYALRIGGMSTDDAVYQKGVKYLLRTQDDDGSWFVNKRAFPANNYFDGGFPHGESQYSSFNGTCWATLALMPAVK